MFWLRFNGIRSPVSNTIPELACPLIVEADRMSITLHVLRMSQSVQVSGTRGDACDDAATLARVAEAPRHEIAECQP